MTTAPARPAFKVLGTTNDVTECEHCGRTELKGTIVLAPLDEGGAPEGDAVYFGAVCGARAAGWTVKDIRTQATAADRAAAVARDAALAAYVYETYGTRIRTVRDLGTTYTRRITGKRPIEVVEEFKAATGR